jgi:hypothetical protein
MKSALSAYDWIVLKLYCKNSFAICPVCASALHNLANLKAIYIKTFLIREIDFD